MSILSFTIGIFTLLAISIVFFKTSKDKRTLKYILEERQEFLEKKLQTYPKERKATIVQGNKKQAFIRFIPIVIFFAIHQISILHAENIVLNAKITYTNNSSEKIKNIYHRITIPSSRVYQKVKRIIVVGSDRYKIKPHKKDTSQKYVELKFQMSPHSSKTIAVSFEIEILAYKYDLSWATKNIKQKYINPSQKIESTSNEFKAIAADIIKENPNTSDQVIAAYKVPSKILHYNKQHATTALTALKTKKGDCTEYAMVFVAICRAIGIPARVVNIFNIKNKYKTWTQPNHNEAEIYIPKYGWMPIYSNLGGGSTKNSFSPGKISNTNIIYSHDVWTWSNYLPNTKHLKGLVTQKTIWSVK